MNILLINHYAGCPEMGMEFRPFYLAREWEKSGHNVLIVAASYYPLRSTQPQVSNKQGYCKIENVNYLIIKTPKYSGNRIGRIVNMFCFVYKLMIRSKELAKQFNPDIVIASSTYPSDIYPAKRISKLSKAKLVFEVHDVWPMSPMLLGGLSKWHPFIMLMQHGENYACKKADCLISMLPCTKEHFVQHGLEEHKWFHVPNGIDLETYDIIENLPDSHLKKINQIKKEYKHLALYAGTHGIANSLDTIIESSQFINNKEIAIVLLGKGPEKENLIQKSKVLDLKNIFFLDPVPKSAVPELLAVADILLIAWNRSQLYKYGISPNKIFDYMMAAKPVVHAVEAANDLIKNAQCGISIEPENPEKFAEAIAFLCALPTVEKEQMGMNGKNYVINNHTYKHLANKFLEYISILL